jgi:hypothetical protein
MKKVLLALTLLAGSIASANATCTGPAVMKDNASTTFNMGLSQDASGNCAGEVDWSTTSQAHTDLTAPATLGSASGGLTPTRLSALSTTVTSIKASAAGQLYMLDCSNTNTATVFIQLFDAATAVGVTLGTTTPTLSFEIPPGTSNGFSLSLVGMQFSSGLQAAATTTATGLTAQTGTLPNCNVLSK